MPSEHQCQFCAVCSTNVSSLQSVVQPMSVHCSLLFNQCQCSDGLLFNPCQLSASVKQPMSVQCRLLFNLWPWHESTKRTFLVCLLTVLCCRGEGTQCTTFHSFTFCFLHSFRSGKVCVDVWFGMCCACVRMCLTSVCPRISHLWLVGVWEGGIHLVFSFGANPCGDGLDCCLCMCALTTCNTLPTFQTNSFPWTQSKTQTHKQCAALHPYF